MTGQAELLDARTYASRVQKVRSPSGIEAWLVEDYSVPLLAVNFGFKGGAAQDPVNKPGVATLLAGLLVRSTARPSTRRSRMTRSRCPSRPIATTSRAG